MFRIDSYLADDQKNLILDSSDFRISIIKESDASVYDWDKKIFDKNGKSNIFYSTMEQIDKNVLPGVYTKLIDISNFENGSYIFTLSHNSTIIKISTIHVLEGKAEKDYLTESVELLSIINKNIVGLVHENIRIENVSYDEETGICKSNIYILPRASIDKIDVTFEVTSKIDEGKIVEWKQEKK